MDTFTEVLIATYASYLIVLVALVMLVFRQFMLTMIAGILLVLDGLWEYTFHVPEPFWLLMWIGGVMFVIAVPFYFLKRARRKKAHVT